MSILEIDGTIWRQVVYINKARHKDVVETIFELNSNWQETYNYIYGDKETFWLAFVMHNIEFI